MLSPWYQKMSILCVDISRKVDADGWITNYECSVTVSKNNTSATFTERLRRK